MHKIMSVDIRIFLKRRTILSQKSCNPYSTQSQQNHPTTDIHQQERWLERFIKPARPVVGWQPRQSYPSSCESNMPERVEAIAARLSQYKTHATLNTQTEIPIAPVPYADTTNPTAATTLQENAQPTMVEETTVDMGNSVQYGWIALRWTSLVWYWIWCHRTVSKPSATDTLTH